MIIKVCAFTDGGRATMHRIFDDWDDVVAVYREHEDLSAWTQDAFSKRIPIVYIGACGIAVRHISPYVNDKMKDSAVIVVDEKGEYVIPILSGHVGGANQIARTIAKRINAQAVITTGTDVNNTFSVDEFAKRNGLIIANKDGIRYVSSKILRGEEVTFYIDDNISVIDYSVPDNIRIMTDYSNEADVVIGKRDVKCALRLIPKEYILGIGCKRGKTFVEIYRTIDSFLSKNEELKGLLGDNLINVSAFATIDIKKKEIGLLEYASYHNIPLITYSSKELESIKGDFSCSEFVKDITGVSNVCERAAMCAAGEGGKLVYKKMAGDGVTLAVAKRIVSIEKW